MAGNSNFDEILTTTLNNYVPKLVDNIFSARPLFYALTNSSTMRTVSGGAKIVVPIIYGANSTAASYSGTDTIDTTAQTGISAAEYDWGQYAATVTINGMEEAKKERHLEDIMKSEGSDEFNASSEILSLEQEIQEMNQKISEKLLVLNKRMEEQNHDSEN